MVRSNLSIFAENPQKRTDLKIIGLYKTGLTGKELEILKLMQNGYTNEQIAKTLDLSDGTTRNYASSIYKKLNTPNRTGAVARAVELGILD